MRHLIAGRKLSRDTDHRRALRRNLAAALFISGRIRTTEAKAKYVRPFVEKLITIARKGDLNARRRVVAMLQDRFIVDSEETDVKRNKNFEVVKAPTLIKKIFSEIAPKYADRSGGYTRIIRLAKPRLGDNGPVVYLELVDPAEEKKTKRVRTGGNRRRKAQLREQFMNAVLKTSKKADPAPAEAEKKSDDANATI
jgi:large subunit ribosomal protein L17